MDDPVRFDELRVAFQETRRRKSFVHAAFVHLRIGEGNPYLVHLVRGEKRTDEFDTRAEKSHIVHPLLRRGLGPPPHARPLDIHAYIIDFGMRRGQPHRIFAATATQFEHDRTIVPEEILSPTSFQRVVFPEYLVESRLHHAAESEVFAEFPEFVLSHAYNFVGKYMRFPKSGRSERLLPDFG